MRRSSLIMAITGVALMASSATLKAAELKVLAGGSTTASMGELGPRFERLTGHKVMFQFGGTPDLIKLATSGAPFDLAVVPVDVMQDAGARATFAAGPTTDVARVGYGVAYRTGAPMPDVSTPDALKQTLLKAQSVGLYPESAAGAYVVKTFARLGIADAMKAKIRPQPPSGIAAAVAKGEVELAVFLTNLLIAQGVELAGPFPGDLQQNLVFTAAVAGNAKEADAAKAFIDFLKTPAAAAVFKAKGVTPG